MGERDRWEVTTEAEFRGLVNGDPDEAVFGFMRLQARVRALRADNSRAVGTLQVVERTLAEAREGYRMGGPPPWLDELLEATRRQLRGQ